MKKTATIMIILMTLAAALLAGCTANEANQELPKPVPTSQAVAENKAVQETPVSGDEPIVAVPAKTSPETIPPTLTVTSAELALHNTQSNCWVAYKGEVYDVTSWLPRHPGGVMAIAKYCGTSSEFETGFTKKHGTSKVDLLKKEGLFKGLLA